MRPMATGRGGWTAQSFCSLIVLMVTLRTLGEAYSAGWGIRIRCQRGDHQGIVRVDPCRFEAGLDMQTLVTTRGRDFPLARVAGRLRCPNCGDMGVQVLFDVPGATIPVFVPQSPYRRRA
jgi:hypothetical protein